MPFISVAKWWKLKNETGAVEFKKGYQKGHSHIITDHKAFEQMLTNYCIVR